MKNPWNSMNVSRNSIGSQLWSIDSIGIMEFCGSSVNRWTGHGTWSWLPVDSPRFQHISTSCITITTPKWIQMGQCFQSTSKQHTTGNIGKLWMWFPIILRVWGLGFGILVCFGFMQVALFWGQLGLWFAPAGLGWSGFLVRVSWLWGFLPNSVFAIDNLVGGFNHLEKYEFVNGKDDNPYIMENKSHIWNHQPAILGSLWC